MKLKVWQAAILAGSLIACKKDDNSSNSNNSETKVSLLTKSTWKYNKAGLDFDNNGTIDADVPAGTFKACETDNTIMFNANGTGIADEGATKCNGTSPQSTAFTWNFSDNQSTLNLSASVFPGMNGDVKLLAVTNSSLILEKMVNLGTNVNVIVELKH